MHLHILGICGTFMGGLALLARAAGHTVTGCDTGAYPPMSTQLAALGIDLTEGFDASQLTLQPDVFVIGNAITRGNPLLEAIFEAGVPYTSGPQWLGEHILPGRHVLAVAGTHGKTTTSSMLAWILQCAGLQPGFLIGGVAHDLGVSAAWSPASNYFVIEADEYDTALFDKRSKFLHYRPRTVVLNNLEYDHADIFPDLAAIQTQFHHLIRTLPARARIVHPAACAEINAVLARGCWSETVMVDASGGDSSDAAGGQNAWQLRSAAGSPATGDCATGDCFTVQRDGQTVGTVRWTLTGAHNRANALAALAAAEHIGVAPQTGIDALNHFTGVKRRLELRGTAGGVHVYDDFAHHPTAIATTLAGLRRQVDAKQPGARILAVLEPRSNTMKLGAMAARLPEALAQADHVYCFGAVAGQHALGWQPEVVLAPLGARAAAFDKLDTLVARVAADAQPGDHVLVMSNGSFGGVHERLLAALANTTSLQTKESP